MGCKSLTYSNFGTSLKVVHRDFDRIQKTCAGAYRYGFNGMEGDDEVKGDNNSYTTEFRQYDPRLGRWLSLDPVTKPHLSPYISMSNNPISRVDPRGDDDFFDLDGNYLGSTDKGHTIRIVTSNVTFEVAQNNISNNTKVLSDFNYLAKENENRFMLSMVASYYSVYAGINEIIQVEEYAKSSSAAAFYHPCSEGLPPCDDDYFAIAVSKEGLINSALDDAANLVNTLVHEKNHQDNYDTHQPLDHINSVLIQSIDDTWNQTTISFKRGALKYSAYLLNEALKRGTEINKINEKIAEIQASPLGKVGTLVFDIKSNSVYSISNIEEVELSAPKETVK